MPKKKVRRKLTAAEKQERINALLAEDYEDEFEEDVPDNDDSEDIVVIRGTAARSLLKSLGVKYDEDDSEEDEDEEDGEEDEDSDEEDAEESEDEGEESDDESEGKVAKKRITPGAKKVPSSKKDMEQEPAPPSRNRYFGR